MEWTTYQLSDVCTIKKRGVTPKEGVCYALYSLPAFDKSKKPEIIYGQEIKSNKFSIQNNTILFNKLNVRFKRVWNIKELKHSNNICSTEFFPLSVKGDVEQDFLYYYLISDHITEILKKSLSGTSSSHQRIDLNLFLQLPINLPSISDQRKIAGILSALDSKIENNNKINANLEAQAQALFKSWFVDFTPFKDQPFVDSELGSIPQGLKICQISDISHTLETGRRQKGGAVSEGIPSVGAEHVKGIGTYDYSKTKYISPEFANKLKTGKINGYELLIYKDGGKPGYFIPNFSIFGEGYPFDLCYLNEHVFKLDFLQNKGYNIFNYFQFKTNYVMSFLNAQGGKAAIPGINKKDIECIYTFAPNNPKVVEFGNFALPLFTKILRNCVENQRLAALRDTLLPKLMSGEIKL